MSDYTTKNNKQLQAIVVLPFLNEHISLANTCHSLGFGLGTDSIAGNAMLFMVDNASTDDSRQVADIIKNASPKGKVTIGYEAERGYVPPRHYGNLLARGHAKSHGLNESDILILQADADTIYDNGYIESMLSAAQTIDGNILLQATTAYPSEFERNFPEYIELCESIDSQLESLVAEYSLDVIVDDKVSGYRLQDYFQWGGHKREYTSQGEEIHSETARLYAKARATGANRISVNEARTFPSMRKTIEEPSLHFACAGFPRETSWNQQWRTNYSGPTELPDFGRNILHPEVQKAINVRRQHFIALFGLLPLHVSRSLGETISPQDSRLYSDVLSIIPTRTKRDLENSPGIFFSDVFHILDTNNERLLNLLGKTYHFE